MPEQNEQLNLVDLLNQWFTRIDQKLDRIEKEIVDLHNHLDGEVEMTEPEIIVQSFDIPIQSRN